MDKLLESQSFKANNITMFSEQNIVFGLSEDCITEAFFSLTNMTDECFNQLMISANTSILSIEVNVTKNVTTAMIEDQRPFIPRWWIQIFWSILFGIMVVMAIVGNLVVIWIVLANRRMRTVTNYFLLNLTVADLSTASFNAIFNFVFMLNSHWPFGQFYCVVNNFIANLSISVSVFTISATSIDRYVAIVHPLKPRMSKKKALSIIILIWLCGTVFAFPTLMFSKTLSYRYANKEIRTLCIMMWPDGPAGQSSSDNIYNIIFLLLTYVVPIISMAFTYSLIARVLWGHKGIGEFTEFQKESIKSKRKIVRMLMVVVAIFAICWLPYHLYFLYTYKFPEVVHFAYIQHVYLGIYWLAMSNSMYNWMIYCWMNKRFRNYFKQYLFCCVRKKWNQFSSLQRNGCYTNNTRSPTTRYDLVQLSNNYNGNVSSLILKRASVSLNGSRETRT